MKDLLAVLLLPALLAGCPATLSDWPVASSEGVIDVPDGQVEAGLTPEIVVDGSTADIEPVVEPTAEASVGRADVGPIADPDGSISLPDVGPGVDTGSVDSADSACASVTHSNGVGQFWQDCVPLGTYTAEQAIKACAATTGDAAKCGVAPACPPGIGAVATGYMTSSMWEYEGPLVGRVFQGQAGCTPTGGTSTWN